MPAKRKSVFKKRKGKKREPVKTSFQIVREHLTANAPGFRGILYIYIYIYIPIISASLFNFIYFIISCYY